MFAFPRQSTVLGLAITLSVALSGCGGGGTTSTTAPALPSTSTRAVPLSTARSNAPFRYAVHPHLTAVSDDIILKNCSGSNQAYLQCATPTTIKAGYNFPAFSTGGKNQTIAIVDPFGSPTIENDLLAFNSAYGLQAMDATSGSSCPSTAPTSSGNPRFTVYYPGGKPTFNPSDATQVGFAEETSLDVEWAHAAAPQANILLVVPPNDQGQTVQSAQSAAIACGIDVLSLSFGALESSINGGSNNTQLEQAEANYAYAATKHITVIASVGDLGATGGSGNVPNPEYPASSPNVLAVGGTNLILFRNANYNNESVWNDTNNCIKPCSDASAPGATGGAPSSIFAALTDPAHSAEYAAWSAYQQKYASALGPQIRRWTNDVAYNASPNTGVVVYISFLQQYGLSTSTLFAVGGTSQGPPQWAGIIATANASRGNDLGFVNERLYKIFASEASSLTKTPSFHDVTVGNNAFAGAPGYAAIAGWDPPTGLGSANVANLITALQSP